MPLLNAPSLSARPAAGAAVGRWAPRLVALGVWAAAGACAVFWALPFGASLPVPPTTPVAGVSTGAAVGADADALARVLGARPAATRADADQPAVSVLSGRFVLTGVVASHSSRGAALLAVDGKPPKPYAVGARIDEGLVLQAVGPRSAVIAAGMDKAPLLTLELPKPVALLMAVPVAASLSMPPPPPASPPASPSVPAR